MEKKIIQVNESEYNSILRQVVAVIENSKATIAKNINIGINTTHWNIGKLLHDKKLESKHGSGVVNRLSDRKQGPQVVVCNAQFFLLQYRNHKHTVEMRPVH